MIKVETIENENNLETHVEKKKKRRRKKIKKEPSSDLTEGSNLSELASPGSNATAVLVTELDTPGQNEAQKRKRMRRRKRNKKLQVTQGEGVIKTETEKDDSKMVDAGNTGGPVASNAEGATLVMSSNAQKRRRARRRKRNKPKTTEGSVDVELRYKNEINLNVTQLKEINADLVCEGNLNVNTLEGMNSQEKSEAQKKRRKRKNKKKTSIAEGGNHLNQTSDQVANTSNENDLQPVSSPWKKKRNRKRRRNHIGNIPENSPSAGDGSDIKIEENSEEPVVKMMKVSPTNETPSQNAEVRNGPNKKKKRRNRRKKYDKEKPQNNIDLPLCSQENEARITEENERVQNRKRNLEQSKLEGTDSSLSRTQDVNQDDDKKDTEEKNDEHTIKKLRLSPNEENEIPSTPDVGIGSGPNKKRRQRNRRRKYNKANKESAQDSIDLPAGSHQNGVEVIKNIESAKGETRGTEIDNRTESKKADLLGIGEHGTQLVELERNDIGNKGMNNENVNVSSLEGGIPSAQNLGIGNSSYKKRKHRNRKRKYNKDNKEKGEGNVDLLDKSEEKGAGIISSNENVQSKEKGIEGKDSTDMSLEQGSNQNLPSRKRRRNRKRKLNQKLQGTEITDEPEEKVLCGNNVAQNDSDSTVYLFELQDSIQASDDNCNSHVKAKKTKDEVTESPTQASDDHCNIPVEMKKTENEKVIEYPMSGSATSIPAELNTLYVDEDCKKEIHKHWVEEKVQLQKDTGLEVTKEPFTCCYAPDFLKNADYLEGVKDELQDIELIMKSNDLYKFRQTSDLKNISTPHIAGLRRFLYGDFRKWLIDVTGIPLNDTVDMGSSRYEYTDVLLCHDDELEGRRIAYILYLVPPWEKEDGGSLDLFSTDEYGLPKDIVKSFVPKWNAFAFFEVSPVSFHQVAEVLSCDKVRLTINGWFYGPQVERPAKYRSPSIPLEAPTHIEEEEVYSWINPTYLDMDIQREIRHKFRSDSEIELESFLAEDKYQELADALRNSDLTWQQIGPANKQFFEALKLDKVPAIVDDCLNFLKSEAVFLIVSQLTGLKLHRLTPPDSEPDSDAELKESCPRVGIDVRRWSHGCYTLIRDDTVENICALDANLFINVSDKWSQEHGGFISYIAKDEDEELLTVVPRSNRFALVYRDAETLRFTKHINASVSELGNEDSCYNDFACVYYE